MLRTGIYYMQYYITASYITRSAPDFSYACSVLSVAGVQRIPQIADHSACRNELHVTSGKRTVGQDSYPSLALTMVWRKFSANPFWPAIQEMNRKYPDRGRESPFLFAPKSGCASKGQTSSQASQLHKTYTRKSTKLFCLICVQVAH